MSLTRNAINELCAYIQEKCSSIFGNKFWDCRLVCGVEYGTKPDKYETRILALSKFRVFIVHGKTPASIKVDRFFHLLSIRSIQLLNDAEVCIGLDENASGKRRVFFRCEMPARDLAINILTAIKHYFPDCIKSLRSVIELTPNELYNEFSTLPCSKPLLACHNFRRSYAALCDFYDQPFREEVVWDIEKIYGSHRLHILRLDDFTHLLPRDLVPILSVCQFSSFFTGICVDGVKLASDLIEVILMVVRRSQSLTSLVLRNCSLPRDFMSLFASALQANITIPLEAIDFSKNTLDDKKGFLALSSLISKIPTLCTLTMSECVLSEKCVNLVASGLLQALKPNTGAQQLHLVSIDFSGNPLKDELNELQQLISICTSLRSINFSDTGFNIDKLWPSLKFGGLQLETLKLAGCQSGRRNKDSAQNMKEYFSTAVDLKHIDFANTVMCPDLLKALLLGLASNQQLKPFTLLLDGVCDRGCSSVLETCIGGVDASYLSLRDNSLEADAMSVISATSHMPHLRRLDLSGANFTNLRRSAKHAGTLSNILLELVKLVGEEDSQLSELILSDCRLSSHLSVLLNTLGVASSLQLLDITGNEMGNFGARLLAKALQINVSLKTIMVDRNQITGDGFADIAHALKLNNTLVSMPYPLIDVADSLNRPDRVKTLTALADIETSLEKNRRGVGRGQAQYRQAVAALQQKLIGKSEGDDRVSDLCGKLSTALNTVGGDEGNERSMLGVISETLMKLEDCSANLAKEMLAPVREVADAEGIDLHIPSADGNSAARTKLVYSIADYLCELRWKDVNAAVECIVESGTQYNADDKRSVSSWQNKNDSFTAANLCDSLGRSMLRSHRPKSVVIDFCNGESFEEKLSFDLPPTRSSLNHISKSRPKPARKTNAARRRIMAGTVEESVESGMCVSSECEDNSVLYDVAADDTASSPDVSSTSRAQTDLSLDGHSICAPCNPLAAPPSRSAMLPPLSATVSLSNTNGSGLNWSPTGSVPPPLPSSQPPSKISPQPSPRSSTAVQPPATARSYSPVAAMQTSNTTGQPALSSSLVTNVEATPTDAHAVTSAPPPIVPRRNRLGAALIPPSLPPKPDSVTMRPASCAAEDENANSRRSVADMARMFSSSETPFLRRT
uniref:Leucine-rich repeat-containing protein 16A n=1 Tax=Ascaris suum TaxID=6253 RepID=F1KRJ3_ASCSU